MTDRRKATSSINYIIMHNPICGSPLDKNVCIVVLLPRHLEVYSHDYLHFVGWYCPLASVQN